jgi:hypothetical protein
MVKLPEITITPGNLKETERKTNNKNPFQMPDDIEIFSARENDRKMKRDVTFV